MPITASELLLAGSTTIAGALLAQALVHLDSYLEVAAVSPHLPSSPAELECLLDFFRLEKAMYELGYEVNMRPTWVDVPARGILDLLGHE